MIEVRAGGVQTTVQDAGRRARALGVPAGGAADPVARRLANALVGNAAGAAGLEVTLRGPTLHFHADALVAVCGAPFDVTLDGQVAPLWRALPVRAGQVLAVGGTPAGARAFVAVRGGVVGQGVYGSVSTDLRGGFGGLAGRALARGDTVAYGGTGACGPGGPARPPRAFVAAALRVPVASPHVLRALPTADATPAVLAALTGQTFTVSAQADRMGVRVDGRVPAPHDPERVSVPNVPGMVQVPPDGRPIVLLPDAGTHGGYPTPLVVAGVDVPRLAQLRPGDHVTFEVVGVAWAHAALRAQERALRLAEGALRAWYGPQAGCGAGP